MMPLLDVRDLAVAFPSDAGTLKAVNRLSFTIRRGERVGIVGESGAGKSVTALAIMGLLPAPPASVSGEVLLAGQDLLRMRKRDLRRVRGARIAMIFQDPVTCLNPRVTVGAQIVESIRAHEGVSRREARERAVDLLARVGIAAPARRFDEYPHRLSGGMAQRVMIAMALSCGPQLIIADEPTTALDVSIEAQIIELLAELCEERQTGVVLITHDLALLARFADRILVMYGGRIVEEGMVDTIYYAATHPYTWGLMDSVTRADAERRERLPVIEGTPPSAIRLPSGCAFHPRCRYAEPVCHVDVPALIVHEEDNHPSACHFAGTLARSERLSGVTEE